MVQNTETENFKWKQGTSSVVVEKGGFYEVCVGMYCRKKKPLLQLLQNGEVAYQNVAKSGSKEPILQNVSKALFNGHKYYKLSFLEIILLAPRAHL